MRRFLKVALPALLATSCASNGAIDKTDLARLVGREGDVRIDAQIQGANLRLGSNVSIVWEVENLRPEPIAIADIIPEASFDPETATVTLVLGSEVPGNELLPRLHRIVSGETRTFTTAARLGTRPVALSRGFVRIRLVYLANTEPFAQLIEIDQKAVHDSELADSLFMPWVENIRFVTTNDVPLEWSQTGQRLEGSAQERRPVRP